MTSREIEAGRIGVIAALDDVDDSGCLSLVVGAAGFAASASAVVRGASVDSRTSIFGSIFAVPVFVDFRARGFGAGSAIAFGAATAGKFTGTRSPESIAGGLVTSGDGATLIGRVAGSKSVPRAAYGTNGVGTTPAFWNGSTAEVVGTWTTGAPMVAEGPFGSAAWLAGTHRLNPTMNIGRQRPTPTPIPRISFSPSLRFDARCPRKIAHCGAGSNFGVVEKPA